LETFAFETDPNSQLFCEGIARTMAAHFGISVREAVNRINRLWVDPFLGELDVRYHWLESEWADHIYAWYEERLANGTADLPRDVIISRHHEGVRQYWDRNRRET
jgi:hypothetical protein